MVDLAPDQLVAKLVNVSRAAHQGAFKGMQKACLARQATAMKYCTPGSSPFDPMVFPTKTTHTKSGETTGAPFDTGVLRASIYIHVTDENDQISGGVGAGACGVNSNGKLVPGNGQGPDAKPGYVLRVHEGTTKMQKRPFIKRAIEDEAADTEEKLGHGTRDAITQAALL